MMEIILVIIPILLLFCTLFLIKDKNRRKYWKLLGHQIYIRLTTPLQSPSFILYFVFIIIGVGGVGIWISIPIDRLYTVRSIATYSLAILSVAIVDSILDVESKASRDKSIRIFIFSMFVLGVALSVTSISLLNPCYPKIDTYLSISGIIIALILWWIVNWDHSRLMQADLVDMILGSPARTAGQSGAARGTEEEEVALPGDLSSYTVDDNEEKEDAGN